MAIVKAYQGKCCYPGLGFGALSCSFFGSSFKSFSVSFCDRVVNIVEIEQGVAMALALITGASSGIGKATAERLAAAGYSLWLTGRRQERLDLLRQQLVDKYSVQVETFCFDIQKATAVDSFIEQVQSRLSGLDILVNNAGLAKGAEKVQEAKLSDWDEMIDTNIKGLLFLTRKIVPAMIKAQRGTIVNLGSAAGRWVYPGGAVYCATKFAVRAISEGLRMDLAGTGIRVCNIEPGMVDTDFSLIRFGDSAKAKAVYAGMKPLSAADIAESILWVIQQPAHINIQELVIFPTAQAAVGQVHRT